MTKSTMPLRLSQALIDAAKARAGNEHRSAAAQIEHWAMIGRIVERDLTATDLDLLAAGLSTLRVERRRATLPELSDVMAEVDRQREDGTLAHAVLGPVHYRSSEEDPARIEMVAEDGVVGGRFVDGRFVPDSADRAPTAPELSRVGARRR